jgi:hypothetical protein
MMTRHQNRRFYRQMMNYFRHRHHQWLLSLKILSYLRSFRLNWLNHLHHHFLP